MSTIHIHRPTSLRAVRRRADVTGATRDHGPRSLALGGLSALVALPAVLVALSLLLP